MRNPLNKRLIRDIKSNLGRLTAISVMIIITISILSGFLANVDSIKKGIKENKLSCKLEDGCFESYFEVPEEALNSVKDLGMDVYENFYKDKDVLSDTKIRIYKTREEIDLPIVTDGSLPKEKDEIALDRLFAKHNDLETGSIISIDDKDYKITGTFEVPDYTSLFEKNSNLMMDSIHFGVALAASETFENELSGNLNYKYSYYFHDRNLSLKEKNNLAKDIENNLVDNRINIEDFCTAENNQSISFIEEDMGSDEPMMEIFCYILILIMAFVFTITIITTIEEEAPIIGTLLANGYSKMEILSYYMKSSVIVTAVSAVVGNLIGYLVMPNVFKRMYYNSYSLPDFKIELNTRALIITTVIPICIMFLINIIFTIRKLSISPLKFIRGDLKRTRFKKSVKLPNISFLKRFRIRVILQNKANFLMLFIGILFGSMILIFGISMQPLIDNYVSKIESSSISNYQYILKAPYEVDNDDAEKFTMASLKTYYDKAEKDMSVSFYGIKKDSNYLKDFDIDKNDNGIYLSDGFMKKFKVKEGDYLTFNNSYTDEEYSLKVEGSYDYAGALSVFMSEKSLNDLLGYDDEYYNAYFSNDEINIDDKYLASTIVPDDIIKLGEQMTSSFGSSAAICVCAAAMIFMALMYILTKIVIDKNSLYISYMKVFGYNEKEIRKLYLHATTIVVIASFIIEIPLENYILKNVFELAMVKVSGYIEIFIYPYIYLVVAVIGILSYIIINGLHMKKINKIKMSDALKNRE